MTIDIRSINSEILNGFLDDHLDSITQALRVRRERINRLKFYDLVPGTAVKFTATTKPKYLAGVTGTVVSQRNTKVVVDIGRTIGRYNSRIVAPPQLLEIVKPKEVTT